MSFEPIYYHYLVEQSICTISVKVQTTFANYTKTLAGVKISTALQYIGKRKTLLIYDTNECLNWEWHQSLPDKWQFTKLIKFMKFNLKCTEQGLYN